MKNKKNTSFKASFFMTCLQLENEIKTSGTTFILDENIPSINIKQEDLNIILSRLIINSIQNKKEQTDVKIKISYSSNSSHHIFSIIDNGIGVENIDANVLFNPMNTTTEEEDKNSFGLGLATCKKIVNLYNGKIWTKKNTNGAHFLFSIIKK